MRAYSVVLAILATIAFAHSASAQDRTFGGFDCTDDCSGHSAGYKWADQHNIDDEADCPDGNSQSFHEGCIAYTQDSNKDPDEDDQGHTVGVPIAPPADADDDDNDDK